MRLFDIDLFKAGEIGVTADGHLAKFIAYNEAETYFPLVLDIEGATYNFTSRGKYQRTGQHPLDLVGLYDEEIKYTGLCRSLWDEYMIALIRAGVPYNDALGQVYLILEERKKCH